MEIPLQITSRDLDLTEANKTDINKYAEKLDTMFNRIISCKVVIEALRHRPNRGKLYNVQIVINVPGSELVVNRKPNEDYHLAVRDAFNAAYRELKDFVARQRGNVKRHEQTPHARIISIFPEKGFGLLTTPDGREVYFHEHSVTNHKFNKLEIGMDVRFTEEEGDKGPQAIAVTVI